MKIKILIVGLLLLSAAPRPSEGGEPSDPQSPRVEEAVALAKATEKSAAEISGTLPKPESGEIPADVLSRLNKELGALTKKIRKVRSLAEDAATDGDPGIGSGVVQVKMSLARTGNILNSIPEEALSDKRPLAGYRKAVKEVKKALARVSTLEVDLKEGRLPAQKDPFAVFGDSPGGPVRPNPAQEVGRGKAATP